MSLTQRYGLVRARATFVYAAIAAAASTAEDGAGFRANDVRFFFLLFANWLEHDVVRPDQDLDLTQVRRVLEPLVKSGEARASKARTARRARRGRTYVLTAAGIGSVVEELVDFHEERPFDEMLFIILFAASYRDLIATHARKASRRTGDAIARRVAALLDPHRILRAARRTARAVSSDLEARVAAGRAIEQEAIDARNQGLDSVSVARRLERVDAYQLQRVRSLSELFASFPEAVARHEIERGIGLRQRLLFEPLAERARAELAILDGIERRLRKSPSPS